MLKKYSLYFKIANYLIFLHGLGHYLGHLTTFVNYDQASPELKSLFESMQGAQTGGGNGIWDLFLMFSMSYTIFQFMLSVLNLVLIYSDAIQLAIMKRIVFVNLLLWIFSFSTFLLTSAIAITLYSNAVFVLFYFFAYLLISREGGGRKQHQ